MHCIMCRHKVPVLYCSQKISLLGCVQYICRLYCSINATPYTERFLLYYGYLGTRFRGVDKEVYKHRRYEVDTCLISAFEKALDTVDPYTPNKNLCISSRTDAGVHALKSTAHCDLWIPKSVAVKHKCSQAEYLSNQLNKLFARDNDDVRVFKALRVPKTFHARFSATSRTYLYRFGVLDMDNKDCSKVSYGYYDALIPMAELNRTHFIEPPFDLNVATEACKLLIGEKDFAAFTSTKKNYSNSSIRNIFRMDISEAQPLMNPQYDPTYNGLKFYNLVVSANSFCYRQVRRMVTVIFAIGSGRYSLDYLKILLQNPKTCHFDPRMKSSAGYGLYLVNVEYPSESFIFEDDISEPVDEDNKKFNSALIQNYDEEVTMKT